MAKIPHIEDLLKRPNIKKPQEEFILPSAPNIPPNPPPNVFLTLPISSAAPSSIVHTLTDEADQVQGLIDIIVGSANEIEVSVPETEAAITGPTISTRQYIDALQADSSDPNATRIRSAFEYGVLTSSPEDWPLLALSDLFDLRDTLRSTADVMTGNALAATQFASGQEWAQNAVDSHMSKIRESIIRNSVEYRAKFLHTVLTLHLSLQGGFFEALFEPILASPEKEVRKGLTDLKDLLVRIKHLFVFHLYFRRVEFSQIRDVVENVVVAHLTRSVLQSMVVLLSKATNQLADPVLNFLENGFNGSAPLTHATDYVSQQVAGVLVDAVGALVSYYGEIAADVIRAQNRKSKSSLDKLQVLGEHSVTSRWIQHLDQAINLIDVALAQTTLTREAANQAVNRISNGLGPSTSKILAQVQQIPNIDSIQVVPFTFRSSVF